MTSEKSLIRARRYLSILRSLEDSMARKSVESSMHEVLEEISGTGSAPILNQTEKTGLERIEQKIMELDNRLCTIPSKETTQKVSINELKRNLERLKIKIKKIEEN